MRIRTALLVLLSGGVAALLLYLPREIARPQPTPGTDHARPIRAEPARVFASPRRNEGEIQAGLSFLKAGRYAEALEHFARATAIDPDDWRGPAYQSMTLMQQASDEPDRKRRRALLQEAQKLGAVLVKRGLVELSDPLFRFIRGVSLSMEGEDGKAYFELSAALRAPRQRFERYGEIELRKNLERAFARAALKISGRLITVGKFEQAEAELERMDSFLPDSDPNRPRYERLCAIVSEHLGKLEDAVRHLRACMRLRKDDPRVTEELTGVIAMMYITNERLDEGRKVLAEVDPKSRHPEIIAARCTLIYKEGLRARGQKLDDAIVFHRNAIAAYPEQKRYRLVEQFTDLVRAKVGPRDVKKEKALLEEAIRLALPEIERRPECPSLYYALYRIYKLLGDSEQEILYQSLYERKKKEWEHKEKYDQRGRPRCR